jgi:hypothetical protein
MSIRHDEGFGSGFGFGDGPHLDWDGTQTIRGGAAFRDPRNRRFYLEDEMGWNGFGVRTMADRFNAYDRPFGGYGHMSGFERNAYGYPYAYERSMHNNPYAYGAPYERNVGFGYGHPYERAAYERNVGFGYGHPYERAAYERHAAIYGNPYERQYGFNTIHGAYNTPFGWNNTGMFGVTPWIVLNPY